MNHFNRQQSTPTFRLLKTRFTPKLRDGFIGTFPSWSVKGDSLVKAPAYVIQASYNSHRRVRRF